MRSVQVAPGIALGTVKGPARDDNQDRAVVARIVHGSRSSENLTVAVICDGMGGMVDGGAAAALAASTFLSELVGDQGPLDLRLSWAIHQANRAVFNRYGGRGGTTLTAIAFDDLNNSYAIHVGDTRLYRRTPVDLTLMTTDDTVQGVVAARSSEVRDEDNFDSHLIQFVGIGPEMEPHVIATSGEFELGKLPVAWLLTTDGAHGLGRHMLSGVSSNSSSIVDLTRKLMYVADAAGLNDNATTIAVFPNDLIDAPVFHDGITFSAWTPTKTAEIWLSGEVSLKAARPSESPRVTEPPAQSPPKNTRGRSNSPKKADRSASQAPRNRPKKNPPKPSPSDGSPPPQLNITFGDAPPADD